MVAQASVEPVAGGEPTALRRRRKVYGQFEIACKVRDKSSRCERTRVRAPLPPLLSLDDLVDRIFDWNCSSAVATRIARW